MMVVMMRMIRISTTLKIMKLTMRMMMRRRMMKRRRRRRIMKE